MQQNLDVSLSSLHDASRARARARVVSRVADRPAPGSRLDGIGPPTALLLIGAAAAFKLSIILDGSYHAFMVGLVCLLVSLGSLILGRVRVFQATRRPAPPLDEEAAPRPR